MVGDKQRALQAAADRLAARLRAFHAAPPCDEKQVMAAMFRHMATRADVAGRTTTARHTSDVPGDADAAW